MNYTKDVQWLGLTQAEIIAQFIGVAMVIVTIIGTQSKHQKHMLAAYSLQNFLEIAQFFVLGAFTGFFTSLLAMVRSIILFFYKRANRTPHFTFLIVYSLIAVAIGYFTWANFWSLIPVVATILYTIGFWQHRPVVSRICIIIVAFGMSVYTISQDGYIGSISSMIECLSAVVALFRHDLVKNKKKRRPQTAVSKR